jgi:hypothetical protein
MRSTVLYLHIGLMKTGTTYLQRTLHGATAELARAGLDLYPANQVEAHRLSKALRGVSIGEAADRVGRRALDRLPGHLRSTRAPSVLVSEEALSFAGEDAVARLRDLVGERETHVVVTVRHLARIIPSTWQERVKAGREMSFERYCDQVAAGESNVARTFWRRQDVAGVASRWEAIAPPERIHVVTAPAVTGSNRRLLLERFCSVLGVDPDVVPDSPAQANESLGFAQTELLRRVNQRVTPALEGHQVHGNVVKRLFAETVLSGQGGRAPKLPATYRDLCERETARMVAAVRERGYDVVGDLADLDSPASSYAAESEQLDRDEVLDAAAAALVALLEREVDRPGS